MYTKKTNLNIAFILTENSINEIEKLFSEINECNSYKETLYTVYFKDGTILKNIKSSEFLKLINVHEKTIQGLNIDNKFIDDLYVSIYFENKLNSPIHYEINSKKEKDLVYFDNKIKYFCYSFKPSYSFFATFIPFMSIISGLFSYLYCIFLNDILKKFIKGDMYFLVFLIIACLGSFLIVFIVPKLFKFIFPPGIFSINSGVSRLKYNFWLRNILLTAILIPLATLLLKSLFS